MSQRDRKAYVKDSVFARLRNECPTMGLDDGAADGQTQSHPLNLCGDEGLEYAFEPGRTDARPRIYHSEADALPTLARGAYLYPLRLDPGDATESRAFWTRLRNTTSS